MNQVKIGQVYHDIGGERRGRSVSRYVKVVRFEGLLTTPLVVVQNTATNRSVHISPSRLLDTSRFALISDVPASPEENLSDASRQAAVV